MILGVDKIIESLDGCTLPVLSEMLHSYIFICLLHIFVSLIYELLGV